jgi:hypothetical protein
MENQGRRTALPLTTHTLWRLPEFKSFCEAAGIEYYLPIPGDKDRPGNGMVIEIPFDLNGLVTVTQTYQCRPGFRDTTKAIAESEGMPKNHTEPNAVIETTTLHNKNIRTHCLRDGESK